MFLLGLVAMSTSCTSDSGDGLYASAESGPEVSARRLDHEPEIAHLGAPLAPTGPVYLYATTNDGSRHALEVTTADVEGKAWLRLGDEVWSAETISRSASGAVIGFALDPPAADAAAALFGVPRQDRVPLDAGLSAAFTVEDSGTGPVVVVRARNDAGAPLVLIAGGGAGGSRDASFSFEIRAADGSIVPIPPAMGFGRPPTRHAFAVGDGVEARADLSQWVVLPPGTYTARCGWHAVLAPADAPLDATDRHRRWDWVPEGEVVVTIPGPGADPPPR